VRRVGARQMVDFTPGRPCVRPRLRRTSVVKGVPRSRWLTALGLHDPLVIWWQPQTWPSWLAREALTARPDSLVLREACYHFGRPAFRTRQVTLVTSLLDAQTSRACDLAGLYRQRWQVATSLAHLKTTIQLDVLPCKTVSGVLKELTVCALVHNLVRMVMWHSALRQPIDVERISFLDEVSVDGLYGFERFILQSARRPTDVSGSLRSLARGASGGW
jgi:hypothetical protein